MPPKIKLWFCDFWYPETEAAIRANYLFRMLALRFDITLDSRAPDFLFYSCYGYRFRLYQCPRVFFTAENMRPDFAECDFALSFDPDIAGRNHRLTLHGGRNLSALLAPRNANAADKTAFCNFIYSNAKCETRNRFFHLLSAQKNVAAAGPLFNNTPPPSARMDKDWARHKVEFIRPYKFTIAFENESHPGYITEKITDAFVAGTVPIYWGSPNIAETFNPQSFINCHDFPDLESCVHKVMEVDGDNAQYAAYLRASPFVNNTLPPAAQHSRALDFVASAFANPPQKIAAHSTWSRLCRHTPRFIHKRIIRARRTALKHRGSL